MTAAHSLVRLFLYPYIYSHHSSCLVFSKGELLLYGMKGGERGDVVAVSSACK